MKKHEYQVNVTWTGNEGKGTADLTGYSRSLQAAVSGKPVIEGSADPGYMGDPNKWNPEDMLLASLSSCHMLWYLGLCAMQKIIVNKYEDQIEGVVTTDPSGGGVFTEIVIKPKIELDDPSQLEAAKGLHDVAHKKCFIANSLSCPVKIEPVFS